MNAYTGFDSLPIAGTWRAGGYGQSAEDVNPYSDDVLTTIPLADSSDVDQAFHAAARAQQEWASTLPTQRAEVFLRAAQVMVDRKDEIVDWLVREAGGIRARAEWEWLAVRAVMLEAASYPTRSAGRILPAALIEGKENRVYRKPLGVITVISPWNFPMQLSNRSVAPALALGNAVVLKPASDTPVTGGLLLAKILEEAGLPDGLLSVVAGKSSEIGDAVTQHPLTRLVSFTGSTPVGKGIAAGAPLTKMSLELGGNGPLLILDDADLDAAVDAAVFGSFFHQGQVCMATNRIVAVASVHDEVVDRLTDRVRALTVGDPADPSTQIGPIINDSQVDSILDKIDRARSDGAEVRVSGERSGPARRVLGPHLLLGSNAVATAAEEVFGPVATVIRADNEDDAVRIANDTEYGLSSAVFSRDVDRAVRVAGRIDAGMSHVNDTTINDEPNTAFGGEKNSGIGRFGGEWAIEEFTTDQWISVQHTRRQYAI
ncbi:aldehyde dehydrogenase family protein [Rhodococcus fascians]|nr:aldehyde dehydrogenase family protein [Rhodococcus fascians]MBY3999096.1 aldehyde dehydrogenase family protein [Rhodococcus fascians]MBY4000172.1 aldehyde dehydrogenase family protein [Rhodococcus fascians]MBY4005200.1 aldehyde dehydrogenase family protein [Rhodococcus fascians]MBY4016850.1 aldehyde dehydrogenase family protein [Rhodococcus fascians]